MFEEKVLGGILGFVAADALGVPVEFEDREELRLNPVIDMRGYGSYDVPAGSWSDDSSMTLCALESLTHGLDYDDMMSRFLRWADEGYMTPHGEVFDMGKTTREALLRYAQGIPALECGASSEWENGNGSLMRMLPVAFYLYHLRCTTIGTIPHGHRKTLTRLSRRQPERYDISGSIPDRIIKLIIAIDTSGSMSAETLERIMVEVFDIIGTRLCEVTVIECDAKIQRIYKVSSPKDISYNIQGRGGTSFVPVIDFINCNRQFRDAILIYFTDGMGDRSIPRPLTLKNIWVLHNEHCRLSLSNPYGEILVID